VQARTQLVVFVSPGDAGLDAGRILVTIQREGSSFLGHLELTGPGTLGTPMSVRDVKDEHCSDVVDALGLITSLAIDPNAAVTAVVPPRLPPPSPLAVSLPVQPDMVPKVVSRARWGVGAAFTVATGVAQGGVAGGSVYGEVMSHRSESEVESAVAFAPSARLGVTFASNGAFEARTVESLLVAAHADGCPGYLRIPGRVTLGACMGVDAGVVNASAPRAVTPHTADPLWLDLTLLGRVRWLAGTWSGWATYAELEGGMMVPLTRPNFGTDTGPESAPGGFQSVYSVPPVAAVGSIGAKVCFP
jgi:hypothetical protein